MKRKSNYIGTIFVSVCLAVLILDTKTALVGAQKGIDLCIRSIIPTMLPFCILSKYICSGMIGKKIIFLQPIARITGMPAGSESILLLSFLGGYPLGAQCIDDAYSCGVIMKSDAMRLLGFCNNAGPAFLFGILSCLFSSVAPLWALYLIHIISAILVGMILPNKSAFSCDIQPKIPITLPQAVERSAKTIAVICSWIILFKILFAYIEKCSIFQNNTIAMTLISGILELSNGCISLLQVKCLGLRYILCALFLNFGGLCVGLQTVAVAKHIQTTVYFPGKLLQAAISVLFASLSQCILFNGQNIYPINSILISCTLMIVIGVAFFQRRKIIVAFAK